MMAKPAHHSGEVFLQLRLAGGFKFGPGKAALLRAIDEAGSISGAARRLGMSYRRAWSLVSEMNGAFREPVVVTRVGGAPDAAATLGELGLQLSQHYSQLERQVDETSRTFVAFMADHMAVRARNDPPRGPPSDA